MLRRTPMTRRNAPEARAAQRAAERAATLAAPFTATLRPLHTARMGRCDGVAVAVPKEDVLTSEAYRRAVRGLECMRCGHPPRSQFCHTDEGKGTGIKTDDRKGWAGCGPHDGTPGCHHFVGTSGTLPKAERRAEDARLAAKTRETLRARGLWPKSVPEWSEE